MLAHAFWTPRRQHYSDFCQNSFLDINIESLPTLSLLNTDWKKLLLLENTIRIELFLIGVCRYLVFGRGLKVIAYIPG